MAAMISMKVQPDLYPDSFRILYGSVSASNASIGKYIPGHDIIPDPTGGMFIVDTDGEYHIWVK